MKKPSARDLYLDLKNFGLNPYDWIIQKSSNLKIELCHIEMPELKICGVPQIKNSKLKWKSLEIIEL